MLRSVKSLHGSTLEATDGSIGRVDDVYFDDASWKVRYILANTGAWLPERLVLLSPASLGEPGERTMPVSLTKDQIKDSPGINSDEPVSRQHERLIAAHYGWPPYWEGYKMMLGKIAERKVDSHLRSAHEVIGYKVEATDGSIGRISDLILQTEDWTVRYVVVDLSAWLPDRKVLLDPHWFSQFRWDHAIATIDHTRNQIERAPNYHASEAINRVYEAQLYDFYGQPKYWD